MSTSSRRSFIVAGMAVLLALLGWLVFSQFRKPPQNVTPPDSKTEPMPKDTSGSKAYVEAGGKVKVEIPLLGWVEGVKLPSTPMQSFTGKVITPEIVITDEDGNFVYMRNHPPLHKATRSPEGLRRSFAETTKRINESSGGSHQPPRILAAGALKFSDPQIFQELANQILGGDPSTWDTEIWGVRFAATLEAGEQNGFLVSETDGRMDAGSFGVPSKHGLTRKYTFYGYVSKEAGFTSMGAFDVAEDWVGEPPVSEIEQRKGIEAQQNHQLRMTQGDDEKK